jgi:hypothetical protein
MALIVQTCGVVGTLLAATIAVRSYVNSNKHAEEARKKEQETRDRELETREAQLFSSIYQQYATETMEKTMWITTKIELKNVDDWKNLIKDIEKASAWSLALDYFDGVGVFVGEGLIDIRLVAKLMGGTVVSYWERFEEGIKEVRREYNFPRIGYDTEFLYHRLKNYEKEHPEMLFVSPSKDTFTG